jgi:hypothetical protein
VPAVDPRAEYEQRIARIAVQSAAGERSHLLISNVRLALFAVAAAMAWLALARDAFGVGWLLAPALAFLAILIVHARVLTANERLARARRHYERGLSRLAGTWSGTGPDGTSFLGQHPYARDLDLFGPGSLFQLIDVARTEAGEAALADWFRSPADAATVRLRQEAVAEFRDRVDFREALAVLAAEAHVSRTGSLARWAASTPVGFGFTERALFAGCAVANAAVVTAMFMAWIPSIAALAWLGVSGTIALRYKARVWQVIRGIDAAAHDLSLLETLLGRLENETFGAARLKTLHAALSGESRPSMLIAQLRRSIGLRDMLRNEIARPFALLLFVRSQASVAIDGWHQRHRATLIAWLDTVGEFEALASLATYAYEHPADVFPTIAEGERVFRGTSIAHPLLNEATAVRNDVAIGGAGPQVLIVSGSNMSGKSTLLRAVGVNAVLALAGGPVRAAELTISPLAIGASIRVEDSLQEGHSRFYAEILRLKDVLALTRDRTAVLFLLDEILHGTNSHDRRIGAEAVVRSLVGAGAIGLVTTHDLALTRLAESMDGAARNVHFEDRIENGRMVFDYRMRSGVVERSNALELMRAVGIDV